LVWLPAEQTRQPRDIGRNSYSHLFSQSCFLASFEKSAHNLALSLVESRSSSAASSAEISPTTYAWLSGLSANERSATEEETVSTRRLVTSPDEADLDGARGDRGKAAEGTVEWYAGIGWAGRDAGEELASHDNIATTVLELAFIEESHRGGREQFKQTWLFVEAPSFSSIPKSSCARSR